MESTLQGERVCQINEQVSEIMAPVLDIIWERSKVDKSSKSSNSRANCCMYLSETGLEAARCNGDLEGDTRPFVLQRQLPPASFSS